MTKEIFNYLLIAAVLSCGVQKSLFAQEKYLSFNYLTADDGLSDNYISFIYRDSKDYVWIGTADQGVNKFNGYQTKVYQPEYNKPGTLSGGSVSCVFEDKNNNVWIGTFNGLNLYVPEKDSFLVYQNIPGDSTSIAGNWVYDILEDKEGNLWIVLGAGGGLCKWIPEEQKFEQYSIPDGVIPNYPNRNSLVSAGRDSKGVFWVLNFGRGIYSFDPRTKEYKYYNDSTDGLSNHGWKTLLVDEKDKIWVVSFEDGFYSFDTSNKKFKHYGKLIGLDGSQSKVLTGLIQIDADHILIGADQGGISSFNKQNETFENFLCQDCNVQGLNSLGVRYIYIDRENILWVGTTRGGINYSNPKQNKFRTVNHISNLAFDKLRNIISWLYEDSEGRVWVGTDGGGVDIYDPETGKFDNLHHDPNDPNSLSGNVIRCIAEDKDHNFWIGTWDAGLNRYNPKTMKFDRYYPGPNASDISSNAIWNFTIDHNNLMWMTSFFGGIDLFDTERGVIKRFRSDTNIPGSLSHNLVWLIKEDNDHNIWVSTSNGVNLYNPNTEKFRVYHFPDDDIRAFYRGRDGSLWAGSVSRGLYEFDMDGTILNNYDVSNGLADNTIHAILEDNSGSLWVSTNNGLSQLDPKTQEINNYYKQDGLQGNLFYELSAEKSRSGEFFFGGYNGFNSFLPDSLRANDFIPPIYFTDFKVFNKSVVPGSSDLILNEHISVAKSVRLTSKHTVFSIEFAGINYTNPQNNDYAYILENFEKEWNYVDNKMNATYTNLDPGEYVFKVKVSNNDGVWNDQPATLKIIVEPAFWQTGIFRVGVIFIFFAGMVGYYYVRFERIKRQRKMLKTLVQERTLELEERKKEIEGQAEKLQIQNKKLQEQKDKLQQTQLQLVQSEKMASLGILTAGVAHEINNPLNFIQTGLYSIETILADEKISSYTLNRVLDHIKLGVNRASAIVKSLNTFSRKDSQEFRKCDIHNVISNALLLLNHELKYKCEVETHFTEEQFTLMGNDENLHQVFINIIMNALHAIEENGKITISTNIVDHRLVVKVRDNGSGMSKEELNQIFDPFFTTKGPGKGVGLGLSIVYKIIVEHKGEIEYSSEKNKGTEVKITLPISYLNNK
ncbi:sensor histidine kinase [Marinoscillum sp. MHG1-6]|uniref:sensor histidine kinase n=1 Tax=Marinoscillum sp. MHG1-6 TaxID=2959627 RepID=UPI00215787CB|nr:sensor histidine kinase [Marinoscillum sp. MHG1-6]